MYHTMRSVSRPRDRSRPGSCRHIPRTASKQPRYDQFLRLIYQWTNTSELFAGSTSVILTPETDTNSLTITSRSACVHRVKSIGFSVCTDVAWSAEIEVSVEIRRRGEREIDPQLTISKEVQVGVRSCERKGRGLTR